MSPLKLVKCPRCYVPAVAQMNLDGQPISYQCRCGFVFWPIKHPSWVQPVKQEAGGSPRADARGISVEKQEAGE